jgi:Mitochondrial K+-H+ exchange-related
MTVFLVPAGRGRFELYSEAASASVEEVPSAGWFRRFLHSANARWHGLVAAAQQGRGRGRLARWRDRLICAVAESIAEQRTLWALRLVDAATVRMPTSLSTAEAHALVRTALTHARRHHARWLAVDLVCFVLSGVVAIVPGPNLIAYYFAFRVVGHLQSYRGARQGLERIAWSFVPDSGLSELATLVDVPRDSRAQRVEAIAQRLELADLAAFFDRVAVPSR